MNVIPSLSFIFSNYFHKSIMVDFDTKTKKYEVPIMPSSFFPFRSFIASPFLSWSIMCISFFPIYHFLICGMMFKLDLNWNSCIKNIYPYYTRLLFHNFLTFAKLDIFGKTLSYLCYPFPLEQVIPFHSLCVDCIGIRFCNTTIKLNNCLVLLVIVSYKWHTINCLTNMHLNQKLKHWHNVCALKIHLNISLNAWFLWIDCMCWCCWWLSHCGWRKQRFKL